MSSIRLLLTGAACATGALELAPLELLELLELLALAVRDAGISSGSLDELELELELDPELTLGVLILADGRVMLTGAWSTWSSPQPSAGTSARGSSEVENSDAIRW